MLRARTLGTGPCADNRRTLCSPPKLTRCRVALTLVADETRRWEPMSREQFAELVRGQRLQDWQGQLWTVRAAPYLEAGEYRVVLNAGDQVLIERERYADSYMLVEDAA